jgi:hypothetical protein
MILKNEVIDVGIKIQNIISKRKLQREDYESLTESFFEICHLDTRHDIGNMLVFAKGRINEIKDYPNLVRGLAQFTLSRFQGRNTEILKLMDEFSTHKDMASVVYYYLITDNPRCEYNSKNYIRRQAALDLFSDSTRSKGIAKNLQSLGISCQERDLFEAGLLEDIDHLMKSRDAELSALIYENKNLLDAVMCMSQFKRQTMIKKMLEDLSKVTLSEKHFPSMANLLLNLIDNQVNGVFAPYMDQFYRLAVFSISKMAAKPGYQKSQVLRQQLEEMARDRAEHFDIESCFYAAIGANFSEALVGHLKQSPVANLIKTTSEKDIIAALNKMTSCKAPLYRIIEAFDLQIGEKHLNKIKRESLMRDLNM